jgi:hypothetical protein
MGERELINMQKISECPLCKSNKYEIQDTANGYVFDCNKCDYRHRYQFDIFGLPLPEMKEGEM